MREMDPFSLAMYNAELVQLTAEIGEETTVFTTCSSLSGANGDESACHSIIPLYVCPASNLVENALA